MITLNRFNIYRWFAQADIENSLNFINNDGIKFQTLQTKSQNTLVNNS